MESLSSMLTVLASKGCYPSIYRRGQLWRAHVNAAGNFWADNHSPRKALAMAIEAWEKAGCPMDGMGDTEKEN